MYCIAYFPFVSFVPTRSDAMAQVVCSPTMFGLMECMAKNENNPLSCTDLKRALATCVAHAAAARKQKSTLYSDINRFIFSMERRDGKR